MRNFIARVIVVVLAAFGSIAAGIVTSHAEPEPYTEHDAVKTCESLVSEKTGADNFGVTHVQREKTARWSVVGDALVNGRPTAFACYVSAHGTIKGAGVVDTKTEHVLYTK
jgi:hypothetical protein